ncbi:response regulator transcription factor [Candidatus Clostridium stratigraminis]|uniref:response regulator transcription factor n=1 Tax=Candidatus Clostridium stratigraminis TaxID=3381661 RepID=UPI003877911B
MITYYLLKDLIALDNLCKILVVDDEYLLRQGIKHLVEWNKEGFEIVGEASNGKEALSLIETLKPHIVITDIVMPVMDGLELVRYIKENYPEIQIVILSGYSDFNYVKGTFKLGISDNILKPKLNPEEVLTLLKNIALSIPNLVINADKIELNVSNELSKFASGFATDLSLITEVFPYDSFIFIGMDTKRIYDKASKNPSNIKLLLSKKSKTFFDKFVFYELDIDKDIFILLINFEKKSQGELLKAVNEMLLNMSVAYPDIYFTLSDIFISLNKIKEVYNNNFRSLLGCKFFLKDKKLISKEELPKNAYKEKFDFKHYSEMLYELNISSAFNYLKQYISNALTYCSINEFELKTLFQSALYNIISILDELHFDVVDINHSKIEYFQKIDAAKYGSELLNILESIEQVIAKIINNKEFSVNDEIINKITQYISNHYNEQLSLKEIADKFHFNYYYLSSYFSSHLAEGFSEYLNKIRVEKAIELLKNEDIPVSEVSYLVGYSDHSYFCKVFKKLKKATPSKFRKNIMLSKRGNYE